MHRRIILLLNINLIVLGIILLILNIKKILLFDGLLIASLVLMAGTTIAVSLWGNDRFGKTYLLFMLILPLIFYNYIYVITQGTIVGYLDPHYHFNQLRDLIDNSGFVSFSNIERISFAFIGLYLLILIGSGISGLDLSSLSIAIPPLLNLLIIVSIYLIICRIHSNEIALVAALIYGWDNKVLLFGQELRTQTIGTLFFLLFFVLMYASWDKYQHKKINFDISALILLSGIIISSFVSFFYAMIAFIAMLTAEALWHILHKGRIHGMYINLRVVTIFTSLFFFYFSYIGINYKKMVSAIYVIYRETLSLSENPINSVGQSASQHLYGVFITYINYALWLILIISFVIYFIYFFIKNEPKYFLFIFGFGSLIAITFISNFLGFLNVGRSYVLSLIILVTSFSFLILKLKNIFKDNKYLYIFKIFSFMLILLFIIVSVAKLPDYIIGNAYPVRASEPIDLIDYWNADIPQYQINSFILSSSINQSICLKLSIPRYYLLDSMRKLSRKGICGAILIHDKFFGKDFTNRNILPAISLLELNSKLYSNGDYLMYVRF